MTGPQPLPKRVLHILRSSTSSFHLQHPLFSLRSSTAAYVFFIIFPSLLCFPISFLQQHISKGSFYVRCEKCSWLSFFLLHVGTFSPPWFYVLPLHLSHDRSNCSSPAPRFKTSQAFLIHFPQFPRFSTIHGEFETIWKKSINPLLCRWLNGNVNDICGKDPHWISFQDTPLLYLQLALLSLSPHKFARSPCCYYRVLEMKKFRRPGVLHGMQLISLLKLDKLVQNLNGGTDPPPTNTVWWSSCLYRASTVLTHYFITPNWYKQL